MKSKRWKELWLCSIFTCCGGLFYLSQIKASQAKQLRYFKSEINSFSQLPSFRVRKTTAPECKGCHKSISNSEFNLVKTETNPQYGAKLLSVVDLNPVSLQEVSRKLTIPSILQISSTVNAENAENVSLDKLASDTVISQNEATSDPENGNSGDSGDSGDSENPDFSEKVPPPVEGQTTEIKNPSTEDIEEQLENPELDRIGKIEKLIKILRENIEKSADPNNDPELGRIIVREKPTQLKPNSGGIIDPELGVLKLRAKPIEQLPLPQPREDDFEPIGSLTARFGYFHTSNIFSSEKNPQADGLVYSGLSLSSIPIKLAPKTYIRGSVGGNLFRYLDNSKFNYNQFRVNLNVFQRLNRKMYAELGWRHQKLFYARGSDRFNFSPGDKFLDENSLHLSLGRRDPLSKRLMLDSFYEVKVNLTNPSVKRNRVVNFLSVSLNYYFKRSLRLGLGYQYNYSDFIERIREDQYHRILANLNYGISKDSNLSLQSGLTIGDSTQGNIDFDNWFFSVNYSLRLGQF